MEKRTRVAFGWRVTATMISLLIGYAGPALAQVHPAGTVRGTSVSLPSRELALAQAVQHAFAHNPELRAAEARLEEAQGQLTSAAIYPFNPTVSGGAMAHMSGPDRNTPDLNVGLGQEIEIAGQRRKRRDAARARLVAERASLLRSKRLLAARVHLAFIASLEARELLEVARRDVELSRRLHELAERRLERGSATQLDVNVAAAELGRSEVRFQSADADYSLARALLAEVMGLEPSFLPLPLGELRVELAAPPSVDEVVRAARTRRADLRALLDSEVESQARYRLARAEAWPNVTLNVLAGTEEGTALLGGALSIPIPLFNRNQGRIQETRAGIERSTAERERGELSAEREVVGAHARYQAGIRTAERLRELVLGTLEQNLELLQRSFDAGKATWPEVVLIRRTLVDAQRELTAAEAQARRAWIELRVASGQMPIPQAQTAATTDLSGEQP